MEENKTTPPTEEVNEVTAENNTAIKSDKKDKKKGSKKDQEHLLELEKTIEEQKDKYLRLYSEFDNYRKRTINEKLELTKHASEGIIVSLLPIIDDFERAIKLNESATDIEPIKEGIQLIYNKFNSLLEQKGVKKMSTIGEVFNTALHEALTQFPAPNEESKGKVMDEIEKGYYLNEKVIRYAKVVVAN